MMTFVCCPSCHWPAVLPEKKRNEQLRHRCLNCGSEYDTSTAPILPDMRGGGPAPPAAKTAPPVQTAEPAHQSVFRLTSPHICSNCHGNLPASGTRRTDVRCPQCAKSTAVYAILYRCPEPTCDARLESPRERRGKMDRCPKCGEQFLVPSDLLFNDERDQADHTWFAFSAPCCGQVIECRQSAARSTAVCPHCLRVMTVPISGEAIAPPPRLPTGDVREMLHSMVTRPCPRCGRPVTGEARLCRACGNPLC
jgi:predicted RNA-binding Zn-ribbon protein involved in translation (DUF1610 family)